MAGVKERPCGYTKLARRLVGSTPSGSREPLQAAQKEPGAGGQEQRQPELSDDQPVAHTGAGPARGCARSTLLEQLEEIRPERVPGGCSAGEATGDQGREQRKRRHAPVDLHLVQPRDPRRRESDHATDGEDCEDESERATGDGQQDSFGHLLERHPAVAAAQRCPDRQVAAPRGPAHQEEQGHVGAGDDEQEEHGGECRPQRWRCFARQPLQQRLDRDSISAGGVHDGIASAACSAVMPSGRNSSYFSSLGKATPRGRTPTTTAGL